MAATSGPATSGPATDATIGALGEFGLIAAVTAKLSQGEPVLLGPGDDAAVLAVPDGRVVVTTDVLVEGRHFRRDWAPAYDIGRRAAAQNLADVAAMGGIATAIVVGLAAPADLPATWALELTDGLRDECAVVGASVVGGDVVRATSGVTIAVTALGSLAGRAPVTRAGARAGDVVAVCGRLGWAGAGLAVLRRGFRSPRVLVDAYRRPEPPYAAGPEAADLGATALVDVSDGLLQDLGHVADASGVRIDVHSDAFEVPAPMRDTGAALGVDPLTWLLSGGDDHAFAATFPPGTELPSGWRVVGEVLPPAGSTADVSPPSVTVDGQQWAVTGFDHFRDE